MPMHGNHLAHYINSFVLPCFHAYNEWILADALAGFVRSEERADEIADQSYKRLVSRPALGDWDDDLSQDAEVATEKGQLYYEMLTGMRQATMYPFTGRF